MRITFLNGLYPPHGAGGAETTLGWLAQQLAARGHDCSVVSLTPHNSTSEDKIDGIPVHYLPLANVLWPFGSDRPRALRPLYQIADAFNPIMQRRLASKLIQLRPDILHCHNLQGFSVSAWKAAARLGIPIVQTIHDYYLACPRSAMWRPRQGNCRRACTECRVFAAPRRALSGHPAAVTCVSHRVFDRLVAAGSFAQAARGLQPVRIIRGNNSDGPLPAPVPNPGSGIRLGFIGRIDPLKGLDALLDAMAVLPPTALSLRIAGTGAPDYVAALKAKAGSMSNVAFLGHVNPASFFATLDLLVIPSQWEDPFPRVFHEALAHGVPSLVTPLGGLPEVIESGRTGFIAPGSDATSLAGAIMELLRNRWDYATVRAACHAAAARYAPGEVVAQYEAVLTAAAHRTMVPEEAGEVWRPSVSGAGTTSARQVACHGI